MIIIINLYTFFLFSVQHMCFLFYGPICYSPGIMGNIITSSIASAILPTLMSVTGTVIKGVGTIHGGVTPFISKVAEVGLFALFG